ncbi:hypothetical protein AAG570_010459 [Ranatra chinensis]|uniref:RRM domain-containing protein n=1 Tax=Ranatra chinensis TaxID=642074 RepID=A0ABD0YMN0_9HEMI
MFRWKEQNESLSKEECIAESGRIFIRNLSYTVTEEELQKLFEKYGPVTEIILPVDRLTRQVKGYGVVTYMIPENAAKAYMSLDGTVLHGRMLHLLPGKPKNDETDEEGDLSFKAKKAKKLKANAQSSHTWNTLFLGQDAVAEVIAERYDATKQEVLTGKDAAVRLALGETQIVAETRQFLEENGVKLDVFNQQVNKRSKTTILIKNLPAMTTASEIRDIFAKFGELGRVVLPPYGITGIVEFLEPSEARAAFTRLAYSKFKHTPLYLEWAPENTLSGVEVNKIKVEENQNDESEDKKEKLENEEEDIEPEPDTTLFVKNLNFSTNEEAVKEHFSGCGKIANVSIGRKKDPANPGKLMSMGYGFVQFYLKSSLNDALKRLQGSNLDGHSIELKRSNRTLQTDVVNTRKSTNVKLQTGTKILVRNIPFQATEREIRELFKPFGELKSVRLPKKMVGTGPHRGFGFVDFVTKHDAKRAMKALCQSTHFFGRRLVLEWAQNDEDVDQLRKRTAEQFHSG